MFRLLEHQSKYGMDQETMLLYMNSVNLMSILDLLGRRHGGSLNLTLPAPAAMPALPPLTAQTPSNSNPNLENLLGMAMKLLGNQGGANAAGGQGINPALLMSLLGAMGGQNMDLGGIVGKLAGLMGAPKQAPEPANVVQTAPSGEAGPAPGAKESGLSVKNSGEEKPVKREIPKIMKWDQLEERKKA